KEKNQEVFEWLNDGTKIKLLNVGHKYGIENFQRNFGLAPNQTRDNRSFDGQVVVTDSLYRKRRVRSEFLHIAGSKPITTINSSLVGELSHATGYSIAQV
uniref:hypothetical protein n=1 Tax=Escherichia coli TaxID=562 RepID=UPI001CCF1089